MTSILNISEKEMKALTNAIKDRIDTLEQTILASDELSKARGINPMTKTLREELRTLIALNERKFK